jgi:hypothetical protein
MNDTAVSALNARTGPEAVPPLEDLIGGLAAIAENGIELRDEVVVWNGGARWASPPPGDFPDLTGWECFVNSFHLEDEVPVKRRRTADGEPRISREDQVVLLRQGMALGLAVCRRAAEAELPLAVRCVIATNRTNGTFRFHRIRTGEDWVRTDLNSYDDDDMVVVVELLPQP